MIVYDRNNSEKYDFSEDEIKEIYEMRKAYEELDAREKFLVREALGIYFYTKQKK